MASSRKRKRQADDSFRKNFRELRDTGAPDTGPKRPKSKKAVSLTPAVASSTTRARSSGSGGSSREREGGRGRGRQGRRGSGRRSLGEQTPQTRLRTDIRALINSAVERGDVTPAPPITELTPHTQSMPHSSPQRDSLAVDSTRQSMSPATDMEIEVGREAISGSVTETHIPPAAGDSAAIAEDTPTQESRVLRSALKGIHSLSSLRKRTLLSQTAFSVTFRDNVTVPEVGLDKTGHGSDFSLGSSSVSTPSPLSHRASAATVAIGDATEPGEPLEPLEEEDDEVPEDKDEEEEEEEGVGVKLRTPHLVERPPGPSPRQSTTKQNSTRQKKDASKKAKKPKGSPAEKGSRSPPKTLSRALIKNLFMLSGKRRMTADAAALVVKFSEVFLKRASQDLVEYARHAGRKTLEVDDAVLLLKRQRLLTESETFEYLVNSHLPLEYVQELLPCAVAGKKIVPARVK